MRTSMHHADLLGAGARADGTPVCPACGGVECLCRPRFFPGQVLTDDDLNRLDRYVVGKNKLHNRHLHGWGVVCGLEIVCDPCSPHQVRVRSGYALAPCGEDIVVCRDEQVDICRLIEACRDDTRPICDDPWNPPQRGCPDAEQRWVLAICYDERPSRGVTALTPDTDNACCTKCSVAGGRCGCGGGGVRSGGGRAKSGGCGCGGEGGGGKAPSSSGSGGGCSCGTAGARPATAASVAKARKLQCEPTMICEGYRFTAYRAPDQKKRDTPTDFDNRAQGLSAIQLQLAQMQKQWGPMLTRIFACMLYGFELRETLPAGGSQAAIYKAYTDYLEALQAFAAEHNNHFCLIMRRLNQLAAAAQTQVITAADFAVLDNLLFELITECICSALLPPCPEPAPLNCVPLGVVTVRRGADCQVIEICNWEERKFSVNFPTLSYWIPTAVFAWLRTVIQQLCCKPNRLDVAALVGASLKTVRNKKVTSTPDPAIKAAAGAGAAAPPAAAFDFNQVVDRLFADDDQTYRELLATSSVGPLAALMQVANAPDGVRGLFAPVLDLAAGAGKAAPVAGAAAAGAHADVASLHATVSDLAKKVSAQDKTIKELKTRLARRGR